MFNVLTLLKVVGLNPGINHTRDVYLKFSKKHILFSCGKIWEAKNSRERNCQSFLMMSVS